MEDALMQSSAQLAQLVAIAFAYHNTLSPSLLCFDLV